MIGKLWLVESRKGHFHFSRTSFQPVFFGKRLTAYIALRQKERTYLAIALILRW
jgi:hypothetical protein